MLDTLSHADFVKLSVTLWVGYMVGTEESHPWGDIKESVGYTSIHM